MCCKPQGAVEMECRGMEGEEGVSVVLGDVPDPVVVMPTAAGVTPALAAVGSEGEEGKAGLGRLFSLGRGLELGRFGLAK
jgi:hypothetical protein